MTYKFQLLSDIHLEFGKCKKIPVMAKYLILAGDIGYPEQKMFKEFLTDVSKVYEKVFYVSGNHEYYQNWKKGKNIKINTIEETNIIIKKTIEEIGDNIYFLNNDFYDIDDDVRIVGSTLWTDIKPDSYAINDSYQIYLDSANKTLINDEYIKNLHKENVNFIKTQIDYAKEYNKKLVVITHHMPSYQLVLDKYKVERYDKYNSHFASDLDYLIKDPIKVWCAGHSHGFNTKNINGIDCYVNAFGYPSEDRNGSTLDFTFKIDI
jgi:predicted phosphodiesterase